MKTKAFSLLEVMLVLALSGLVVAIAWSVYGHFFLFAQEYQKRTGDSRQVMLLDHALRHDSRRAASMQMEENAWVFMGRESDTLSAYHTGSGWILRRSVASQDTFWVNVLDQKVSESVQQYLLDIGYGPDADNRSQLRYRVRKKAKARLEEPLGEIDD